MSWFDKIIPPKIKTRAGLDKRVPEGLWNKCTGCQAVLYAMALQHSLQVCPKCGHHMRISARMRLAGFLDDGQCEWLFDAVRPLDALKFRDSKRYRDRLSDAKKRSGASEALLVAAGELHGAKVAAMAFEFDFMGGSMGAVVGERFVRAADYALQQRPPVDLFFDQRRRAHARGVVFADADGKNRRRTQPPARQCNPIHLSADQPHHGRRVGEFGNVG